MKTMKTNKFTMIELVTVISIMAILLSISIVAMKTDSTSTNASIIGSTLKYAQVHAMSKLSSDQVIEVSVEVDSITVSTVDTITLDRTLVRTERLVGGSRVTAGTGIYIYDKNGKPDTIGIVTFVISDFKDDSNNVKISLRPFTGKVVYY